MTNIAMTNTQATKELDPDSAEYLAAYLKDNNDRPTGAAGPSPLAILRQPIVQYDVTQIATVRTLTGYDGVVVLWKIPPPPNTPPPNGWGVPWFERMLILTADAGAVTFFPTDKDVIIIDFKKGFDPTPENLHWYAHLFLVKKPDGGPAPGGCPIVT